MKHVRKFEGFRNNKPEINSEEKINETVFQVDNIYRVNVIVDVEAKLLSAYAKKVKQNTGKEINDLLSNAMIAEEIVRWVLKDGLDVEKIPGNAIIGGAQGQAQPSQAQTQVQTQVEPQGQAQGQDMEEVQAQGQGQTQVQGQAQTQGQGQAQTQGQSQGGEELPI